MIKTVLFVHGTGVRKASYEFTLARVAKGLHAIAPEVRLEPCLWGDTHGAALRMAGASIPDFAPAPAAAPKDDQIVALWELLARDPLFELRELSASSPAGMAAPSVMRVKAGMAAALADLKEDLSVHALLDGGVLSGQWGRAHAIVSKSHALKDAMEATRTAYAPLRIAIARALVACVQHQLADSNLPVLDVRVRNKIVDRCITLLGGKEMGGVMDWLEGRLIGLAVNWANAKARRERDALFSSAAPTAGDVVMYQARGQEIRDFIETRIRECGPDVAVIAHSLGGIACVDLLIKKSLPEVKLLVTAGSQSPFLYEINALSSLEFGEPLPEHFPTRWLNFFDRNDLLSYAASKVFKDRAVDIEVHSEQPFPDSHAAYWDNPMLWDSLQAHLQK